MTSKPRPQGWFTRQVRKFLEEEWDNDYMRLGAVNRWECREKCWVRVGRDIGIDAIMQLIRDRYDAVEGRILEANQHSFRKAINRARKNIDVDLTLPGMKRDVLREQLYPIRDRYIRIPGPERDFSELIRLRDIDFEVIYQMAEVRDEGIRADQLSKEDYDFMDSIRSSLKASNTHTLDRVFMLGENESS